MRVGVACVVATFAAGCGTSTSTPPPAAGSCNYESLAALSNYSSSEVGGFTPADKGYFGYGVELGKDPALSISAGRAFYVARDIGQMFELDPYCGTPLPGARVFDLNVGYSGSANPQDVAIAPDSTFWVPRYNDPSVLILHPDAGVADSIDLTSYDPDGNPNASAIAVAETGDAGAAKAFVALEVLDDSTLPYPTPYPDRPSLILRIDVATQQIEASLPLLGRNPFGLFVPFDGSLWLAEPGSVDAADETLAGIERFDPQTSTSTLVVKESDVGGASVMQVALTAGCGAAIVADPSPKNLTALVTFDPASGSLYSTWTRPAFGPTTDYDLEGMLWVGSVLLVGDRTVTSTGKYAVHTFDLVAPCTLHERPDTIFLPLQPVAFATPPR
jgi:streptogramin lyase